MSWRSVGLLVILLPRMPSTSHIDLDLSLLLRSLSCASLLKRIIGRGREKTKALYQLHQADER